MKTISIYTLLFALLALGVSSCGKTTKGKITNDWKVTAFEDRLEYLTPNSYHVLYQTFMTENSVVRKDIEDPNGSATVAYSMTGTVNKHEFTIEKNGTWVWISDVTYTTGALSDRYLTEQSGSWNFVGKTKGDDFKKNERVLFNIELQKTRNIQTEGQVVLSTVDDRLTFSPGQNTKIYTVRESKKNKLELEMESSYLYADKTNENRRAGSQKLTLESK